MKFDDIVNGYLNEDLNARTPAFEARGRGRPKALAKLYKPSDKAFEVGYTNDSVEGRIIQFLDDKPATMEDLVGFLQQHFDEYHAVSQCKEKIREMMMDDILDFAPDSVATTDDETEIPALDPVDDSEPDLMSHIGGAYHDYQQAGQMHDY